MPVTRRRTLRRIRSALAASATAAVLLLVAGCTATPPAAGTTPLPAEQLSTLAGTLQSAGGTVAPMTVTLYRTSDSGNGTAVKLGSARSASDGSFHIRYPSDEPATSTLYVIAGSGANSRLASALGAAPIPSTIVVNERTTVAAGFALAQFVRGTTIAQSIPGTRNGAAMTRDLVDPTTGQLASVITSAPNGSQTSALATFNSLSNMVAACIQDSSACSTLATLSRTPGHPTPVGTLAALASIARNPANNASGLFTLSTSAGSPYQPALSADQAPSSWLMALRFYGDGNTMNGPGNSAIDAKGNLWITNNYAYSSDPFAQVCGSPYLFELTPTGQYVKGSPFTGGGISGSGYGITLDPRGNVWEGNFGFAAKNCPTPPPHNSVSEFTPSGKAISPDASSTSGGGFTQGGVSWPQGTVSDKAGNIWIENCGNNTITRYPNGNPKKAQSLSNLGVTKPFDIAFNGHGEGYVTGNGNNAVSLLGPDGTVEKTFTGGGLNLPLGVATDSAGNAWVADSASVGIPCPQGALKTVGTPAVTLIRADGSTDPVALTGGGITMPWGIAVDGNDNVWVANFKGQRVTELCGIETSNCPKGVTTGGPISPSDGYAFDGLARNTSVEIDPTGNLWITNNWKLTPPPMSNPGGYEMVAYLGIAGPVRTPLIGPPNSIW